MTVYVGFVPLYNVKNKTKYKFITIFLNIATTKRHQHMELTTLLLETTTAFPPHIYYSSNLTLSSHNATEHSEPRKTPPMQKLDRKRFVSHDCLPVSFSFRNKICFSNSGRNILRILTDFKLNYVIYTVG